MGRFAAAVTVTVGRMRGKIAVVTTLNEIEAATAALPAAEKHESLLFPARRLRGERPALPRTLSAEQVAKWISQDEADAAQLDEPK